MPVLSKKGIIKSLWVDLLCLAFLGLGEPACFTGNSVSWSLGHSSRSSCHRRSPEHQELRDLNWSARLYLANQLWCSDFFTPPTCLIIPHRLPAFLESLMSLKNWCSSHARWLKSSLKHSIRFCCIFFQV